LSELLIAIKSLLPLQRQHQLPLRNFSFAIRTRYICSWTC